MQDSLDDYIRISKNVKQDDPEISKKTATLENIKQQSSQRALKIVEVMIEGKLRPEFFLKSLPYINQEYYQDIVEERSVSKLCGYPVCGKKLPKMPEKRYFVSRKVNKVYDITERKNFCSNLCYKASTYIKNQIDTSPLWSRKCEDILKSHFKLLPPDESGLPGEEISSGLVKSDLQAFTSVTEVTEVLLEDVMDQEMCHEEDNHRGSKVTKAAKYEAKKMDVIEENDESVEVGNKSLENKAGEKENDPSDKNKMIRIQKLKNKFKKTSKKPLIKIIDPLPMQPVKERENRTRTAALNNDNHDGLVIVEPIHGEIKTSERDKNSNDLENYLKKCFNEWCSLETHIFLYGFDEVKHKLNDIRFNELFENMNLSDEQQVQKSRYLQICRRLNLQDMADERFDNGVLDDSRFQPLPDYNKLKVENKALNIKVKSFYGGVVYETGDTNFPVKNEETEESCPSTLPLTAMKDQTALRRKVFLSSLKSTMERTLATLKIFPSEIAADLEDLVKTFKLTADNVIVKPQAMQYIALILLKMLSIKRSDIEEMLESSEGLLYYKSTMKDLSKQQLVDLILNIVTNVDTLINCYFK